MTTLFLSLLFCAQPERIAEPPVPVLTRAGIEQADDAARELRRWINVGSCRDFVISEANVSRYGTHYAVYVIDQSQDEPRLARGVGETLPAAILVAIRSWENRYGR